MKNTIEKPVASMQGNPQSISFFDLKKSDIYVTFIIFVITTIIIACLLFSAKYMHDKKYSSSINDKCSMVIKNKKE